ncbi:MAG TPA: hypothetical protein VNO35_24785 [Steroidobacteraceae bacterium]|nr:hypothetical protein [Steroidobacteraceae bacterium]
MRTSSGEGHEITQRHPGIRLFRTLLYSSAQAANGRDSFGQTMLFNSPIVTGGKVFVPTHTGVAVFGLR